VRIKLWPVTLPGARSAIAGPLAPGELQVLRDRVLIGTATEPVEVGDVQQHGKRRLAAADWARGLRFGSSTAVLGR
jgi:methionyl-tRNA formyltransferase